MSQDATQQRLDATWVGVVVAAVLCRFVIGWFVIATVLVSVAATIANFNCT